MDHKGLYGMLDAIKNAMNATNRASTISPRNTFRLGFLPLMDCAPLVIAKELGFFKEFELNVTLSREIGWASVREKIIYGELHASSAVAGMVHATNYGFGSVASPCVAPMILDTNGNAITLSNALYEEGVRNGKSLRAHIVGMPVNRVLTFGVVHPFASHNLLLRKWLKGSGIDPDRHVRIVAVPPSQMCQNLRAGHLDGFCAGDPYNSVAVQNGWGWIAAHSSEIDANHADKLLMMREIVAEENGEMVSALIAALLKGCQYCANPKNAKLVATLLSQKEYINMPAEVLLPSLTGLYDFGHGRQETLTPFISFFGQDCNEPAIDKERWVLDHMADNGFVPVPKAIAQAQRGVVFRPDLFQKGLQLFKSESRSEALLAS